MSRTPDQISIEPAIPAVFPKPKDHGRITISPGAPQPATSKTFWLVTVENHTVHGGLGTVVAEALQEAEIPTRLRRIGLPDEFCESGSTPYLFRRYGLDPESIAARILELPDIRQRASHQEA